MNKPDAIYFYGTCLIDMLYPKAGLAAMELISREGVEVIFPQVQTCCGQPAFNSGYRNEAREVARVQMACLARDIPVVLPSGSCGGMIKHHYPELFAGQPEETLAKALAGRVYELTEFLVDVLGFSMDDLGKPVKVAVHTSCAARREMGVADKIETLLEGLSGVELLTQDHKAECCGFGGTFAVKQAKVSGAMVEDKTRAIRATGAEVLVSQDCGCLMNIGGAFGKQAQSGQESPRCVHIAEFLLERSVASAQR